MAGFNLSQAKVAAKPNTTYFDQGLVASLILLGLTLAVFGGLRWYISTLEIKNEALDNSVAAKHAELSGARVNRLADFDSRLKYIENTTPEDAALIFADLEKSIIPAVVLSSFAFQHENNRATFSAEAPSFKLLTQQIQTLKQSGVFSAIQINEIKRTPEGLVGFSVEATIEGGTK